MIRKNKFIVFTMLLSIHLTSLFSQSLEEIEKVFPNLSGKEQVDTLLELYTDKPSFGRRTQFAKFVHIIIGKPDATREYILEKLKNTKPVPYQQSPCDFEILITILEEARGKIQTYHFFESIEDYNNTVYELYKEKMDEYLNTYKVIDIRYTMLLDYLCSIDNSKRHITTLEDLPALLEKLTSQGYEELTINSDLIKSRKYYYDTYGWTFED